MKKICNAVLASNVTILHHSADHSVCQYLISHSKTYNHSTHTKRQIPKNSYIFMGHRTILTYLLEEYQTQNYMFVHRNPNSYKPKQRTSKTE